MSLREQLIGTARAWVKAHKDKNASGEAGLTALATSDFVCRSLPSSLGAPDRNREEYAAFQSFAWSMFDSYTITELDIVVDETQRKVICYLKAKGSAAAADYNNEYIHKMLMTDDGKLIKEFDASLDSHAIVNFMEKMQAAQGAKA
jgi:hypothetical protein